MNKLEQLKAEEERLRLIKNESQAKMLEAALQFASDTRLYSTAVRARRNYEEVLKEQGHV